ncbi:hypothetical protein M404DRAFT_1007657 [Pisolithus tinctorius Marx 270]|uniref:Uncharacterized protein n=1 Tax=Pisolithus tinctorius Marx 270 TaxID=870435 RepID=A0A0C3NI62_PISTI|nr:hypothetical protein M404DRAFT_1007657 [Pisolithus tinctorius Marx 270]
MIKVVLWSLATDLGPDPLNHCIIGSKTALNRSCTHDEQKLNYIHALAHDAISIPQPSPSH